MQTHGLQTSLSQQYSGVGHALGFFSQHRGNDGQQGLEQKWLQLVSIRMTSVEVKKLVTGLNFLFIVLVDTASGL